MDAPHIECLERFNLASAMVDARVNEGKADKVAFYWQGHNFTYKDIQTMANKTGNVLKSLGIGMEERVAILLPDCPEWVAYFFGAIKVGAVAVPFNTMMKPKDYEYFLNDSRAPVIIVSDDLVGQIDEVKERLRYLKHVIVVGSATGEQLSYHQLLAESSPELEPTDTSRDDAAFWLYTSGSTGEPKGVVHLQHDLLFHGALFYKNFLGVKEDDIIFSVPKLFFSLGAANLGATLCVGASQILLPDRPTPEKVLETIARYRPTVFFGIPTLYANMLSVENLGDYDLSSIRLFLSSGEALPAGIFHKFKERFGIEILEFIGSAEVMTAFIATRPGMARPGSTGELVPGIGVKIVGEEGSEVVVGGTGAIWVNVDSNSPYYWNKHEKSKETMIGDWIRTGDLVRQDEQGYFYFMGRTDDIIEAGGVKVAPVEVEAALSQHPLVLEAAVVGAPDEFGIEKPKAFVVLNNGHKPSAALAGELQQFVKERIAPYNYPRWVEFVTELPKTATGKIQRFRLRQSASRS